MAFGLFLIDCRVREHGGRLACLRALQQLLSGRYQTLSTRLALQVPEDFGVDAAAKAIARQLSAPGMNTVCCLIPALPAHWVHVQTALPLSGAAAASLVSQGILGWDDLYLRPRVDWTDEKQARLPPVEMQILSKISKFLTVIVVTLHSVLNGLIGPFTTSTAESGSVNIERDSVRQARIRQGRADLEMIIRHFGEKGSVVVEDRLVRRWRALAATEFRKQFSR